MNLTINNNYIKYSLIVFILLLDALSLLLIKDNAIMTTAYFLINIVAFTSYCLASKVEDCAIFSIITTLFYTFFIDVLIHYFHQVVLFEAEFLFLIPLFISCLKTNNKNSKIFLLLTFGYFVFNGLVVLLSHKVDFANYSLFIINILAFTCFYYIYSNVEVSNKLIDLFKYIFLLSFILTIIQTFLGFNEDTRNGVFSVFGWGAYTFFIMIFFIYNFKKYLDGENRFFQLFLSLLISCILFICTESKAALIFLFINIVLLLIIKKRLTKKQATFIIIGVLLIPVAYKTLIYFTPKFSHLNNVENILRYFIGNNNTRYEYGRFEALMNVFSSKPLFTKMFGVGFGSSCPLYKVFFEELGRTPIFPYYTNIYGYKYGYQHTSSAILLLDGGIILFSIVVIMILGKLIHSIKKIRKDNDLADFIRAGVIIYLLYYFTYANVLKDFRIMALLGIVFGIKKICEKKDTEG